MTPLSPFDVPVMEGDLEATEWLIQLFDAKGLKWRDDGGRGLSRLAAGRGKIESLTSLRTNGCPWDEATWAASDSRCRPYLVAHGCPGA